MTFLDELFSGSLPPCVCDDASSLSDGKYVSAILADAFARLDGKVGKDILGNDKCWSAEDVQQVKQKLSKLVRKSAIFRYFFRTYSMKWLACVEIGANVAQPNMIKGRYCVTRDVSKKRKGRILRDLDPFSRGIAFEVELDGAGVGEVDHTTVQAPAGTYLSPATPVKKTKGKAGWFFVEDDLCVRTVLDKGSTNSPEAHAWGMLTPGHATIKTKKDWTQLRDQPLRRLPVGESGEHRYLLSLNIAPRLGLRAVGYLALFGISAVAFLMVMLGGFNTSSTNDSFSIGTLLVIASLLITALSNREEESFIRKLLFRLPRWLSVACIVIDVIGFLYFLVVGLLPCGVFPPIPVCYVAFLSLVICSFSLVWCLVWAANCAIRKRYWTSRKDAFETFEVQFHAIGVPRPVSFPVEDKSKRRNGTITA